MATIKDYVNDFGQEDVDRAVATAHNDLKTKPKLRRVKKQAAAFIGPKTKPVAAKPVVGKPTLMNAAPRAEAVTPPAPTPTYGGRPAPAGSRLDEFHVSDQQLAEEKARAAAGPIPKNPAEPEKDRVLTAHAGRKKANQAKYGQDTEPLSEIDQRVKSSQFVGPKIIGPKTQEESERKPFSSSDLSLALATAEADKASKIKSGKKLKRAGKGGLTVDDKQIASIRGQITEATDRESAQNGRISAAKDQLEKGARSPKVAPNVPKPSTKYVWDSKADKMGTRGKRGKITHLSEDEDSEIRAGLTAAADAREGGQNRKFVPSSTDWQGKTPNRSEVEEAAATRAQRGPNPGPHNVTGQNMVSEGTNRPAGKMYRAAANAQKRFDKAPDASDFEYEHPDVLAKEANLAGTDLNDPKFKSEGHMSEARARARIIVHGGVKENAAKNLKGESLLGVHDLIMGKKRFEEGRIGSGNEYTFSHENGGIGATDTFETGNKVNGVNEERPVPIGHTFKRSTNELPKGSGELVTSNAPGSDYTAGETRPLSGFEGWTRTQRRAEDGTTRHVWVENKLPKDIVHAADTVVEHINKYKRISPKMATKDRLKNRAEADKQNAIAGETETYGLDTRNKRNRNGAPTGANVTATAQSQATGRARAAWATGDVEDAATIDAATPTESDSALSRARHVEAAKTFINPTGAAKVHRGEPKKGTVTRLSTDPVAPTPAQAPGAAIPTPPPLTGKKKKATRKFTGATVPGTSESARVSLDTIDKPVKEGGTGKSTNVRSLRGLPTLEAGDEAGVSVKGGRKNPFTGRVGNEGTGFVPAMDTAVVRTAGAPQVSQQFTRQQAMAALASTPAPTQTPRKVVKKNDKLTEKESSLVKTVKDDDVTSLASGGTRSRTSGKAPMYAAGTRVTHPEHGGGHVIGSDETGLAVRFDSNPGTAVDLPHGEVSREEDKNLRVPTRGQFAAKPIKETAEPREGVLDLGENTGKPLDK
jgi:hypothetical protein